MRRTRKREKRAGRALCPLEVSNRKSRGGERQVSNRKSYFHKCSLVFLYTLTVLGLGTRRPGTRQDLGPGTSQDFTTVVPGLFGYYSVSQVA